MVSFSPLGKKQASPLGAGEKDPRCEITISPRREFSHNVTFHRVKVFRGNGSHFWSCPAEKSGERGSSSIPGIPGITVLIPHLKIDAPITKNDFHYLWWRPWRFHVCENSPVGAISKFATREIWWFLFYPRRKRLPSKREKKTIISPTSRNYYTSR